MVNRQGRSGQIAVGTFASGRRAPDAAAAGDGGAREREGYAAGKAAGGVRGGGAGGGAELPRLVAAFFFSFEMLSQR
jgi:hypothetical protein